MKAHGFIDRSATVVLGGLTPRELAGVNEVIALTDRERDLVTSWSSTSGFSAVGSHPGRGKYLVKVGQRVGLPLSIDLRTRERQLYDTDATMGAA